MYISKSFRLEMYQVKICAILNIILPSAYTVIYRWYETKCRLSRRGISQKWRKKFVLFAFLLFTANKTNSFFRFLEESTWRQSCFLFHLTFSTSISYKKMLKSFFDILLYLNRSGKVVKNKELKTTERLKIILNSITSRHLRVLTTCQGCIHQKTFF